jgi:hypothetical protein
MNRDEFLAGILQTREAALERDRVAVRKMLAEKPTFDICCVRPIARALKQEESEEFELLREAHGLAFEDMPEAFEVELKQRTLTFINQKVGA